MSLISTKPFICYCYVCQFECCLLFWKKYTSFSIFEFRHQFFYLSLNISMVNENAYLCILLVILSEKWNLSSKGWSAMNLESFKNWSLFLNFNVFLIFVVDKFLSSKPKIIFIYHHTNHNWIISYLLHFLCGNKSWDSPTSCTRAWTPTSTRCITS